MNEQTFLAEKRMEMVREQFFTAVQEGATLPKTLTDAVFKYQDELRTAAYVILPENAAGEIKDPDEKTLEDYYQTQSARFTVPETRDFSVLTLMPSDIAPSIAVTDEELEEAFEQRRAEFDTPEKRDVVQIPFSNEEDAKAALAKLRAGDGISKITSERGLNAEDIALKDVTRDRMLSPVIADAAFSLKVGEFSEPVQGPLGYVVLHVTHVTPGVTRSFDAVKSELKDLIAEERARSEVYDVQNSIEDQRAGGASLEDIAQKNNLKIVKFDGVTARGTNTDGTTIDELPAYANLVENVFASEVGDQAPPGDTGNGGYYWIRIDEVKESFVRPIAEVRNEVIAAWKEDQQREKLIALGAALVERGNKGEKIETLAAEVGGKVSISEPTRRFTGTDVLSRNALAELFAVPEGQFAVGPTGQENGIVLMQLRKIENLPSDPSLPQYQQVRAQLQQSIEEDLLSTLAISLQKSHGVRVNENVLRALTASSSPL